MTSVMIMEAKFINRAINKYKDRWGKCPVNIDAFIQSLESYGVSMAVAVGHQSKMYWDMRTQP